MGTTSWNKITVPINADTYNLAADLLTLANTADVVISVATQSERDGLAALAPGGVLPIPTLVFRTDTGFYESWNGTAWGALGTKPGTGPYAMACGTESFTMNGTSSTTQAVTFPANRFTQAPIVALGKAMSAGRLFAFAATGVTTTGFTLHCQTVDNSNSSASVASYWTATQMTPTSGGG